MAKKWAEVQGSPQYRALPPDKQEAARQQYFNQVIVPQLPADKVEIARKQFDASTNPADAVPMPAAPSVAATDTAPEDPSLASRAWSSIKGMASSVADTVANDPVLGMWADAAKTTAVGAPETAAAIAHNGIVTAGAGLKGMALDPLMGAKATGDIERTLAENTYHPRGENAQKLTGAIGELFSPLERGKGAIGDTILDATGSPGLATAGYIAPDVALSILGVRAPTTGAAKVTPAAAAKAAPAVAPARPRSTVAPEAPPVVPSPAPSGLLAGPPQSAMPTVVGNKPLATPSSPMPPPAGQRALPGSGPIPQAPPRAAPVPPPAPTPRNAAPPRPPLKDLKNATPAELHKDAVDTLLKNDVRLTTEQRGSGFLSKQVGSAARGAEILLGKSKITLDQMQDFTASVFEKVGLKARNATADAMAELKKSTQDKYEVAHAETHVNLDGEFAVDLREMQAAARRNPDVETRFDAMMEHVRRNAVPDPANPTAAPRMTAEAATAIRAELGRMQGSANSSVKHFAGELKDALDAAAERSATPAQAAAMREARGQFHFMRQIEDAIVHGKNGSFVSPSKLLNVINRKRNKNEAVYGGGDQRLVELAQAGKKVLPDAVGDSGTATRWWDVAKPLAIIADPVSAMKVGAGALGGRYLNEASPRRGTASVIRETSIKEEMKALQPKRPGVSGPLAVSETEEQKKRRLRAEALRSN